MRVVLSLTTIPGREQFLERALKSIRAQTHLADAIYLWLPDGYCPDRLARISGEVPRLRVGCSEDLGPATKLVPTLSVERDPGTAIITLDDDIEYASSLVHKLVQASLLQPDAAIGFTGWQIATNADELKVRHFDDAFPECAMFQPVHVIEGFRGALYRRAFFRDDLQGHLRALEAFRFHDDVLFSGYLASRNIPRLVRWFDSDSSRVPSAWKLHCTETGLHTTVGWRELGVQCCDYFRSAFAMDRHMHCGYDASERLQLNADSDARPGFSPHCSLAAQGGLNGMIRADLSRLPWPWPDRRFKEVLARSGVPSGELLGRWLMESARITELNGTVQFALSRSALPWLERHCARGKRFTLKKLCLRQDGSAPAGSCPTASTRYDSQAVLEYADDRLLLTLVRR